jgi:hypothetical protein
MGLKRSGTCSNVLKRERSIGNWGMSPRLGRAVRRQAIALPRRCYTTPWDTIILMYGRY